MRNTRLAAVASAMLLFASVVTGETPETLGLGGVVQPDSKVQDALKRLIGDDSAMDLRAVEDLATLTSARGPDDKVRDRARQHLAEQLFLYAVQEKLAIERYDLFQIKNAMRVLQGALYVRNSDYTIAAARNFGHENRVVDETATYILAFLDAFTPIKDKSSGTYHFRELEPYLERVQKLEFALDVAAPRLILAMYREDADAGLNTISRIIRRRARNAQELKALPDLRDEQECIARIKYFMAVATRAEGADGLKPTAGACLTKIAHSPNWYVRLYVPHIFLQDERLLDAKLLDRLAGDSHVLVQQGAGEVRKELKRRGDEREQETDP